jgi:hypothetical protein
MSRTVSGYAYKLSYNSGFFKKNTFIAVELLWWSYCGGVIAVEQGIGAAQNSFIVKVYGNGIIVSCNSIK